MKSINLEHIKNLIFDLGGVILNIAPEKTVQKMKQLGIENFEQLYSQLKQNETFDLLEKGEISENQFVEEILKHVSEPIEKEDIIDAWNELLLDFPREHIELLDQLNKSTRFRTFLLSNTNSIHKKEYNQDLFNRFSKRLEDLFEKAYFSHEIAMRKPDAEIFQHVLDREKLEPSETLFIDDSLENIAAASSLGLETYQIKDGISITDLFPKQLITKQY
ncbi:MAG: HAD family hydrolase [Bacteroidota bacterium]